MSDEPASPLVKELRAKADYASNKGWALVSESFLRRAANEIERLQHDLRDLRHDMTKAMGNHAADATEMERLREEARKTHNVWLDEYESSRDDRVED